MTLVIEGKILGTTKKHVRPQIKANGKTSRSTHAGKLKTIRGQQPFLYQLSLHKVLKIT